MRSVADSDANARTRPQADSRPGRTRAGRGRTWGGRLLLLCIPFAALCIIEAALRLAGVPRRQEDPFLSPEPGERLYRPGRLPDGRKGYISRHGPESRFVLPAFPAKKTPGTLRLVVLGGSAATGFPYSGRVAFAEWLKQGLQAAYGGRAVEMLNCAGCGMSMADLTPYVHELLGYEPDAIVLFSGNNEYRDTHRYRVVRRGSSIAQFLLRTGARLHLVRLIRRAVLGDGSSFRWGFLATESVTQVKAGSTEERRLLLNNYAYTLHVIHQAAKAANVPVVYCTVPVNEADWFPFAWVHSKSLTPREQSAWTARVDGILPLISAKRAGEALAECRTLLERDDRPAILHFLAGRAHEALAEHEAARAAYARALELDVVCNRAFGSLNQTIRRFCARRTLPLADCAEGLRALAPHGLLGNESFFDNCHPQPETHRKLSRTIAEALVNSRCVPDPGPGWQPRFETGLSRHAQQLAIPNDVQAAAQLRIAKAILEGLTYRLVSSDFERAARRIEFALSIDPELYAAHFYRGVVAFLQDDEETAKRAWRREIELHPRCRAATEALRALQRGRLAKKHLLMKWVFNLPEQPRAL
ncbi:MAG: hypothetical protein JXR37_22305 [Kiritimatiellae bacterium]|nr:hypothetical protein [Kiritimatiellia bacterium]